MRSPAVRPRCPRVSFPPPAPGCSARAGVRRQRRRVGAGHPRQGARHRRPAPGGGLHRRPLRPRMDALQGGHGLAFNCWTAFSTPATACAACTACRSARGAALMAALDDAAARAGADAADRRPRARAVGRRAMTACSAWAIVRPDGAHGAPGLRRADAGLQRLRRQRGDGARTAARDARRAVRRPHRQRRQRHRLGPRAGRAAWPTWAATRAMARGPCRRAR